MSELTPEQKGLRYVEQEKATLLQEFCNLQVLYGEQKHTIRALTAKVEALEKENRNLKSKPTCVLSESGYMCSHCGTTLRQDNPDWSVIDDLKAQLAAMRELTRGKQATLAVLYKAILYGLSCSGRKRPGAIIESMSQQDREVLKGP